MAAVQGSQPKSVSKGCFKCGKTGHWSRDCNAPPSEWIARPPTQKDQGNTTGQTQIPEAAEQPKAQLQIPLAAGKRKRQKPKLTVEALKHEQHGIAEVFHTFPDNFRQQFRGKGYEAGDLKRLLDMYVSWQQRVLPFSTFDAFVEALEKLGSSYVLKMELRELRSEVLKVLDEPKQAQDSWLGMGASSPVKPFSAAVDHAKGAEVDDNLPDWDDEDLLAMQAEPMVTGQAAGNSARPPTAPQQGGELELDDEELLELMDDHYNPAPAPAQAPVQTDTGIRGSAAAELDEIDDAELLDLAEADMSQPTSEEQPAQEHQQPQHALQAPHENAWTKQSQRDKQMPSNNRISQDPDGDPDDILLKDNELLELENAGLEQAARVPGKLGDPVGGVGDSSVAPVTDTLDDEELLALAMTQLDEA